jgi:hypothetical protein
MKEKRNLKNAGENCDHNWKQLKTKQGETFLELVCTKCGKKKEIDLFP